MQEYLSLVLRRTAPFPFEPLRAKEYLALGRDRADTRGEETYAGCGPEQRAPVLRNVRHQTEVDDGGEQIADSVTLLHHAGRESTRFHGDVFQRGRRSQAPDAAHGDAEERSHGKELWEGLHKAGPQLQSAAHEQVGDERPPTTITVGNDTEYSSTRRTEEEGECDRGRLQMKKFESG